LGWSWGSQKPFVKGLGAEKKMEIWGLPEENARLHNFLIPWKSVKKSSMGVRENPGVVRFPGSPFELALPFEPAGDQPEAIARLVQGIEDGVAFQTLLGVTGSGKTFHGQCHRPARTPRFGACAQ
jgi:hypothetical protein